MDRYLPDACGRVLENLANNGTRKNQIHRSASKNELRSDTG